ncbi:EamA family transporter [Pseudoalteromonas sp. S16_S37]|uniref:EamA family transporter n=1 Tax=Pseudoalteromonas sp. S16_S37 TaxID=2720228 RepID=UPI0016812D12|nr:EamA family transporter [Pseudoalteromonas sp. S16_S37]MBD1584429.1 EamA family transporter [Pseudoalteromonas sp. S16_S37]
MDLKGVLLALMVVIAWGLNFSVIKFGLADLPPILFSGLRFFIVAIPAILFVPFPKTPFWRVLGVGILLGVFKFSLLFFAMKEDASAGIASLLLQVQVIFTILLSVLIFKEYLSFFQLMGIVIAGVGFSLFFMTTNAGATPQGVVLILLAALFWAFANLIMKGMQGVNLLHFMVWVSAVPPIPLFVLSYFFETSQPVMLLSNMSVQSWLSLAYVGYVSTLLAFAIWGYLLSKYSAASITPFALLIPISGIFGANIMLGEQLAYLEMVGAILILSGLSIGILGPKLKLRKASQKANEIAS